jgi:hypothetical protein
MKQAPRLLTILLFYCFLFSCQKQLKEPIATPISYDVDAQKFIDSSNISDTVYKSGLSNFVKQLKDSSLWQKFAAIYPMVGGSSSSACYNLKDPRNSDAAYRLTFSGAPVFGSSGVLFPSINDYANTHFTDSVLIYNNNSLSYYSLTQNTVDGYDMGCDDHKQYYNEFAIYNSSNASNWFGYYSYGNMPSSTIGLFMLSSTATDVKRYENGVVKDSKGSAPTTGYTGEPILVGYVQGADSGGKRECGLATIGQGLSDTEALTFYNIVLKFEKTLGR